MEDLQPSLKRRNNAVGRLKAKRDDTVLGPLTYSGNQAREPSDPGRLRDGEVLPGFLPRLLTAERLEKQVAIKPTLGDQVSQGGLLLLAE